MGCFFVRRGPVMDLKKIDKEINRLVIEKHLLSESMKRTKNEEEKKEIKKRLIRINAEIRRTKLKYDQVEEKTEEVKVEE